MKKVLSIVVALGVLLFAGSAMAGTFIPPSGDLSALQNVFTGIGSSINVYTDQSGAEAFVPTGFGSSAAAFIAQVTWDQSIPGADVEFGLYEIGNPSNHVTVIPADSTPTTAVTINFDFVAGTVTTRYAGTGVLIDTANFTSPFGFYTYTDWSSTGFLYSEDSLNPSGSTQQLIYAAQGDNISLPGNIHLNDVGHWYVAAEALAINGATSGFYEGGFDFNDMVVMLESVQPVPEPSTLLLLGAGLAGLGYFGRRRRNG